MKALERIKLLKEHAQLVQIIPTLKAMEKIRSLKRMSEIIVLLGGNKIEKITQNKSSTPNYDDDKQIMKDFADKYGYILKENVNGDENISLTVSHKANRKTHIELISLYDKKTKLLKNGTYHLFSQIGEYEYKNLNEAFNQFNQDVFDAEPDKEPLPLNVVSSDLIYTQDGKMRVIKNKNSSYDVQYTDEDANGFWFQSTANVDLAYIAREYDEFANIEQEILQKQGLATNGKNDGSKNLGNQNETAPIPPQAYQLNEKPTATRRQKDNDTAVALMREIVKDGRKATADEKVLVWIIQIF